MALLLGLLIWFIAIALAVPFFTDWWPLPDTITAHARQVDAQYYLTLWVAGLIFLLAQLALGYAIFKFGSKRSGPASHIRGSDRWELLWTTAATVLFVGLTFMGYTVWAEARFTEAASARPADDRLTIEVVGQQFVWNIRYPGRDGKFGPTDIKLIDDALGNPLGVDRDHADGKDDIVVPRMAVPVNREIGAAVAQQRRAARFLRARDANQARHGARHHGNTSVQGGQDGNPTKLCARSCAAWDITR